MLIEYTYLLELLPILFVAGGATLLALIYLTALR